MNEKMKTWFRSVGIKTIKTMAQTAVGVIGSSVVIAQVNWKVCVSSAILSGIACILMNISQIEE